MKTVLLLMAQFETTTLTLDQVRALLGGKAAQTIRNRVSAGRFPRPTTDGVWMIQDVADYLDRTRHAEQVFNGGIDLLRKVAVKSADAFWELLRETDLREAAGISEREFIRNQCDAIQRCEPPHIYPPYRPARGT